MPSALGNIPLDGRVLTEADVLPYDSEVEYLESTGTQYIDTGIVPTQTTRIKFAYLLTQTPTDGFAAAFGCLGATGGASSSENSYSGFALFNNPSVPVQARVGRNTAANIVSDISVAANTRYEGEVQFGRMLLNGTEYTQSGSGSWVTMIRTICTHTANDDSSTLSRRFVQARFFSFSIYDGSTLVRDFIPVRKNGVGYLYDKVSGQLFGNAGTGAFLYGGDVREVEYIESTGTQYIDTGITGGSTSKIEIVAASPNNSEYQALVGARNGALFSFSIWQYSPTTQAAGSRFDYVGSTVGSNPNVAGSNWNTSGLNTVVKDGKDNYLNGVQLTSNNEATFSCPCPFTLFAINDNGSPIYPAKCKMYSCRIYDSGVLVRDFIPYRIGDKGCLYDRVSGKFFTNAGTGDFAVGADVPRLRYFDPDRFNWEISPADVSVSFTGVQSGWTPSIRSLLVNRSAGIVRVEINVLSTVARTNETSYTIGTLAFTGFANVKNMYRTSVGHNDRGFFHINAQTGLSVQTLKAWSANANDVAIFDIETNDL